MRILTAELRKTFTLRFFLVLLIAVAANFLLFRHNLSGGYSFYGQEAYQTGLLQQPGITLCTFLLLPLIFYRKNLTLFWRCLWTQISETEVDLS